MSSTSNAFNTRAASRTASSACLNGENTAMGPSFDPEKPSPLVSIRDVDEADQDLFNEESDNYVYDEAAILSQLPDNFAVDGDRCTGSDSDHAVEVGFDANSRSCAAMEEPSESNNHDSSVDECTADTTDHVVLDEIRHAAIDLEPQADGDMERRNTTVG